MFRGDDDLVAFAGFCDPVANNGLGVADSFGKNRVNGIHFGGVEKVDPCVERHVDLCMAVGFWSLGAKRHRAKAIIADLDAGPAELDTVHL